MNLSIGWSLLVALGVIVLKYSWFSLLIRSGFRCPQNPEVKRDSEKIYREWGHFSFFPVFGHAFLEETIFRFLPIFLALHLKNGFAGIFMIFWAQMVFGYIHGNMRNVAFQGVGGVFLTFLFILFGGLEYPWFGTIVSTIFHTLWNLDCHYSWVWGIMNNIQKIKLGT